MNASTWVSEGGDGPGGYERDLQEVGYKFSALLKNYLEFFQ